MVKFPYTLLYRVFRIPAISVADSSFLIAASVASNILNFLYNSYLGRRLSLEEFGIISLIGSILSLSQIPLSAFSRSLTHRTAYLFGKYHQPNKEIWSYFRKRSYLISGFTVVAWLAFIPFLLPFFQIPYSLPFILITPLWLTQVISTVDGGFLNGSLRFRILASLTVLEVSAQLILTIIFVETGVRDWIYLAMPLSALLSFGLGWLAISKMPQPAAILKPRIIRYFSWRFYGSALLSKLSSVAFLNFDMILAKHYLPPEQAGQYALLALAGKMIYYGSALLGQFVIPLVSREEGAGRDSRPIIKTVLSLTGLIALGGIIGVGIFGEHTVPFLFGEKARAVTPYLLGYTVAMACFGITSILVSYYQSKRRYWYSLAGFILSLGILAGIGSMHDSVGQINIVMTVGGILSLGVMLLIRMLEKIFRSELGKLSLAVIATIIESWLPSLLQHTLPDKIGDYRLQRRFEKPKSNSHYQFGIYRNSNGVTALGKCWNGRLKNLAYWQLKNEMRISSILASAADTLLKKKVSSRISLSVSRIVESQESPGQFIVLFNWIHSQKKPIGPDNFQIKQYSQVFEALEQINLHLDPAIKRILPQRTGWHFIFMYCYFLPKSILVRPQYAGVLLKGSLVFLRSFPGLVTAPAECFTHRDLHSNNILKSNKKMYLVDTAYSVLTLSFYEYLVVLAYNWNTRPLRNWLLSQISEKIKNPKDSVLLHGLAVYIGTQLLTDNSLETSSVKSYITFFDFWLSQSLYRPNASRLDRLLSLKS